MPTSTKWLVAFLAIFAIIVVALNIYRWISPPSPSIKESVNISSSPTPASITPTPTILKFSSRQCAVEISYPSDFSKNEDASGSAVLASADQKTALFVTCNKDESLPSQSIIKTEDVVIASASAKIYFQTIEVAELKTLVIRHPVSNTRIFIAGNGQVFDDAIKTIRFLE